MEQCSRMLSAKCSGDKENVGIGSVPERDED